MGRKAPHDLIVELINEKSLLKSEVYKITVDAFTEFKQSLRKTVNKLNKSMEDPCKDICIEMKSRGEFEAELKVAGDILLFHMHTNIFNFDKDHSIWKTSYTKEDNSRTYCGMIMVYNFLSDSFKYRRMNDTGYLVARIFINKDNHYFVEGKRQLGFLYNDFQNSKLDSKAINSIIESSVLYTLDFDLLTPPYDNMSEISVTEINELSNNMMIKTGKRLGFKFQADSDHVE